MIVKDEEEYLKATLPDKIAGADEVIIVDTGSSDKSVEIAEYLGAKVYHFLWINDFSAARNESLKYAEGEWIFWLDADEFVRKEDLFALKDHLRNTHEKVFTVPIYKVEFGKIEKSPNYYHRFKIFRNHEGIHFIRPINEQLADQEGKTIYETASLDIAVYHWDKNKEQDEARWMKKRERNIQLIKKTIEENPADPDLHYLLAQNYNGLKLYNEAIEEFLHAARTGRKKFLGIQSIIEIARIHLRVNNDYEKALEILKIALKANPKFPPLYSITGWCYLNLNDKEKAKEFALKALENRSNTNTYKYFSQDERVETLLPYIILKKVEK
jgi:glycosyltransferase involved in cell wall biosynthesis